MTRLKKEYELPDPSARAFLNTALEYHLAANTLYSVNRRVESPMYFLYIHSIELALKAYIRSHGQSVPRTHALRALCRQCMDLGFPINIDLVDIIRLLESENKLHGFRYFAFATTSRPEIGYLRQAVDNLMSTITEEVEMRPREDVLKGVVIKYTVGKAVKK